MDPIDEAISQRREIEFLYDGHPRVVQPAAHGTQVDSGNEVLRGYQVGGRSNSRVPPFWTLLLVGKIRDLVVTARTFPEDPPDYRRGDKHMGRIFVEL